MEKDGLEPLEAHIYVCTSCFGVLVTSMLSDPNWVKEQDMPSTLTAVPVPLGLMEPCAGCNNNPATGFIPCYRNFVLFKRDEREGV